MLRVLEMAEPTSNSILIDDHFIELNDVLCLVTVLEPSVAGAV